MRAPVRAETASAGRSTVAAAALSPQVAAIRQVAFVGDHHDRGTGSGAHLAQRVMRERFVSRGYEQHQVGVLCRGEGALDAQPLHRLRCRPQSGGIVQPHRHPVNVQVLADHVARGARYVGHQRAGFPGQAIEQRRLAHVGRPGQHHVDAVAQHAPGAERREHVRDGGAHPSHFGGDLRGRCQLHVLLGEVQPQFHVRGAVQQLAAQIRDECADGAVQAVARAA